MPAKAGTQTFLRALRALGPRFRGDERRRGRDSTRANPALDGSASGCVDVDLVSTPGLQRHFRGREFPRVKGRFPDGMTERPAPLAVRRLVQFPSPSFEPRRGGGAPEGASNSAPRKQVDAVCATCCAETRRAPWTGAHASRRSTAVLTTASTVAQLRTALGGAFAPSPASSLRPARSGRRAEPGAARVRGYEPRPRGPHPIPLSRRLMKTPSVDRTMRNIVIIGILSRDSGTIVMAALIAAIHVVHVPKAVDCEFLSPSP